MLGLLGAAITLGSELSIPSPAGSVTLTPASGAVDASFGTDGYSTVEIGRASCRERV